MVCDVDFLVAERLPEAGRVGARVVTERIARIIAPARVHDNACSIPAIVRIMLAKLPSNNTGFDANWVSDLL